MKHLIKHHSTLFSTFLNMVHVIYKWYLDFSGKIKLLVHLRAIYLIAAPSLPCCFYYCQFFRSILCDKLDNFRSAEINNCIIIHVI